ncbi:MAG: hypothetical protein IJY04_04595, partial [Clostridia bacterium]|nr:hypothetical protein [Clostridia bacterium]
MNNTKYGRALSGKSYVYSRSLDGFIGLDSASEPSRVSPERMAYSVNMWRDYESENGGAIETVPGWRKLFSGNYRVYGLFGFRGCSGSEYLVVHLGASLYRVPMLAMEKKDFSLANYLVGDGMAEHSSVFFEEGGECFILDGSAYWVLGEEGEVRRVDSLGYVPISYRNGVPYQQRNMLSDRFIECCTVGSDHKSSASHYGWIYEKVTTDSEGQFLRIVGTSLSAIELSHAYIPKSDTVEGGGLRVLEIDDSVLRALVHTEQLVCDAPISFQEYSLCAMTSLRRVVLRNPKSRFAFNACDVLDTVNGAYPTVPLTELWLAAPSVTYDGASHPYSDSSVGISSTADRVTLYTAASEDIWFGSEGVWTPRKTDWVKGVIFSEEKAGTVWQHTGVTRAELFTEYAAELDFSAAENKCTVEFSRYFAYSHVHLRVNDNVYCVSLKDPDTGKSGEERGKWYEYAVCDPFSEILAVKVDGAEERRFTANSESGTLLVMVHPADIGKTLYIYGKGEYNRYAPVSGVSTVYDLGLSDSVSSCDAINHCTVVCAYDGRVFLTGNPQMPNTVFYTGVDTKGVNTPSYVGIFNHFSDGIGNITNVAMVANGSVLAVFKGETSGDGTAYYHEAEDNPDDYTETLLPRIYPALSGASNIPCIGAACNFADDTVFISPG